MDDFFEIPYNVQDAFESAVILYMYHYCLKIVSVVVVVKYSSLEDANGK